MGIGSEYYFSLSTFYSILGSTCFIIFFILTIIYLFIYINIIYVRKNWQNTKCKSGIFIGGQQNFNECSSIILADVVNKSTQPFYAGVAELQLFFKELSSQISSSLTKGSSTNNKLLKIFEIIQQIVGKVMVPVISIQQAFNTILLRIRAMLMVMIYFIIASILTIKQFITLLLNAIINVLLILLGLIVAMLMLPFSWGVALTFISIFASIAIPLGLIVALLTPLMGLTILPMPKTPKFRNSCFDQNTLIPLHNGTIKYISDIKVGDVLSSGTTVTTVLILDSTYTKMYSLNNILVTGSHLVKYNNTWISVDSHPNSIYLPLYSSKTIYCINTTSGFIELGNMIFTDWDEMLPDDFTPSPINSLIKLESNISVKIQNININDIIKYSHSQDSYQVIGIAKMIHNNINHYHLYTDSVC
jgi:hypothetical protein